MLKYNKKLQFYIIIHDTQPVKCTDLFPRCSYSKMTLNIPTLFHVVLLCCDPMMMVPCRLKHVGIFGVIL